MLAWNNRILKSLKETGPAAFVTAAFIGPGTLTTCTLAGASWGYALLWGLLFSVTATIILQGMASKLGIIGQTGLGDAIASSFKNPLLKAGAVTLVILAIGAGNAAYETGNITGASLGLESITGITILYSGNRVLRVWPFITGILAFVLLYGGSYKILERILISLVIIMSITFITTAIMVKPSITGILKGLFIPSLPKGSALMMISLIGTTVVPYNLFLHASAAREKWKDRNDIGKSRLDNLISIGFGGVISSAIVITSSAAFTGTNSVITGVTDLATQLEPLLGDISKYFMAVGIFSAGVSSAITAPLAAAYAITGVLRWNTDIKGRRFRLVWFVVLLTGVIFSTFGLRPLKMILMAQFANGLLLPVLAVFLLKVMNNREILGSDRNGPVNNLIGIMIIFITFLLGLKSIGSVTGLF